MRSLAACLQTVHHPKLVLGFDAVLVLGPEHGRVFHEAGWDRERIVDRADRRRQHARAPSWSPAPTAWSRGCPSSSPTRRCRSSRTGGILMAYAGGGAGLFSAIIGGWANGAIGSAPVTREVRTMTTTTVPARSDERAPARRAAAARRGPTRSPARRIGLLDIRKPRGNVFLDQLEVRSDRRRRQGAALRQADVHEAGAGRPAPRDRHPVRARDRGARRLRQLHVVQCARHQ